MTIYYIDLDGVLVDLPIDNDYLSMIAADWADLKPTRYGMELLRIIMEQGYDWRILSAPCTPQSAMGKMMWCQKHGISIDKVILACDKHLLCKPGDVLIDDCHFKLQSWIKAGGSPIFYTDAWVKGHK